MEPADVVLERVQRPPVVLVEDVRVAVVRGSTVAVEIPHLARGRVDPAVLVQVAQGVVHEQVDVFIRVAEQAGPCHLDALVVAEVFPPLDLLVGPPPGEPLAKPAVQIHKRLPAREQPGSREKRQLELGLAVVELVGVPGLVHHRLRVNEPVIRGVVGVPRIGSEIACAEGLQVEDHQVVEVRLGADVADRRQEVVLGRDGVDDVLVPGGNRVAGHEVRDVVRRDLVVLGQDPIEGDHRIERPVARVAHHERVDAQQPPIFQRLDERPAGAVRAGRSPLPSGVRQPLPAARPPHQSAENLGKPPHRKCPPFRSSAVGRIGRARAIVRSTYVSAQFPTFIRKCP